MSIQNIGKNIRAFIFDVDGTLYQQKLLRRFIFKEMVRSIFYNPFKGIEALVCVLSYRLALERLRSLKLSDSAINEMQFEIASRICFIKKEKIKEHVYRWMRSEPKKLFKYAKYPYLDSFLMKAKSNGFKLAVFSDYPIDNKIDALGYNGVFDIEISSQDAFINKLKPDPAGIDYIVKCFGLERTEIIYIGDRYDIDTRTAQNAGVKCIIIGGKKGFNSDEIMCIKSYEELYYIFTNSV